MRWTRDSSSFRDPSGFVFSCQGAIYRQVNFEAAAAYGRLMRSGLYGELVGARLMVAHEEVPLRLPDAPPAAAVLRPEQVPFISYPYEWCFGQLKAAARLTLDIQRRALARGLVLRDASAYNVQFVGTRPAFIDTLSFGEYVEGRPWSAYRQFCQHFLAPLALRAYGDRSLGDLARVHVDGVPLEIAGRLLPVRTRFEPGLFLHLHLHGRAVARAAGGAGSSAGGQRRMSRTAMLGLIDGLERTVDALRCRPTDTLWSTYGSHLNYSDAAQAHKRALVGEMVGTIASRSPVRLLWDLGGNTGAYSRLAARQAELVVSFDGDHASVERNFEESSASGDAVLPLVQDLTNPSPAIGWNGTERRSLFDRGPADLALALAVVHHLAIGANVPLDSIAAFFERICRHLVIEFVPKEDSQVQRMLALRDDVFPDYSQSSFERAFQTRFDILRKAGIEGTLRTLYLLERR